MATFDGAAWVSESVTSAADLDYNPEVICSGDAVEVVWTHDDGNDIFAAGGSITNVLMVRSKLSTGWQASEAVVTADGLIKYSTAGCDSTGKSIVYCLDMDGDLQTDADSELFFVSNPSGSWLVPQRLTDDAVDDVNPQFLNVASGELMLIWAKDGQIISTMDWVGMTGVEDVVSEKGSSGQRGFVSAISLDDEMSVVWNDPSPAGSDLYAALYDSVAEDWSSPVQITDSRDMERSISAAYSAAGDLVLAYNRVALSDADGLDAFGQVDLVVNEVSPAPDAAVLSISLLESSPVLGSTVDVSVTVANLGELACSNVVVSVYDGDPNVDGELVGRITLPGWYSGGAETNLTFAWEVPADTEPHDLYAMVDTAGVRVDKNLLNNQLSQKVLGVNFSIYSMRVENNDADSASVHAVVQNSGALTYTNGLEVVFHFHSPSGAVLGVEKVYLDDPSSKCDVVLEWDMSALAVTSAFYSVYAVIDSNDLIVEQDETDNVSFVEVMTSLDSDEDGLFDGEELDLGTNVNSSDTDGDRMSDFNELLAGTSPTNGASVLVVELLNGDDDILSWHGVDGYYYQLESTLTLSNEWVSVGSVYLGSNSTISASGGEGDDSRFYRVRVSDNPSNL